MNPREPLSDEERILADRLRGEWPAAEPTPELDRAILERARTAVRPDRRRRQPWLVGLATAAALVLTFGVIWRTMEEPPQDELYRAPGPVMSAPERAPPPAASPEAAAGAPAVTPSDAAAPPAPAIAPPPSAPLSRMGPASPVGDAVQTTSNRLSPSGQERSEATGRQTPTADRAVSSMPQPDEQRKAGAPLRELRADQAPEPFPAEAADRAEAAAGSDQERRRMQYAVPAAPPAPPPPQEPSAPEPERTGRAAAAVEPAPAQVQADTALSSGHAAPSRAGSASDDAAAATGGEPAGFDAAVADIRRLLRENRNAEAIEAIAKLRERYPAWTLPEDLAAIERAAAARR